VVPTLVFDGDCAFCTKCVGLIPKRAAAQLTIVPWQFADLAALGLTAEQCIKALQFVDGPKVASGHAAVAEVLRRSGWPLKAIGIVMRVPPVSWVAALTYRAVAANRQRLPGGTAACALPRDDVKSH
jgi:predicted DCC family thiol-disulfide oxidoreductase YuxK